MSLPGKDLDVRGRGKGYLAVCLRDGKFKLFDRGEKKLAANWGSQHAANAKGTGGHEVVLVPVKPTSIRKWRKIKKLNKHKFYKWYPKYFQLLGKVEKIKNEMAMPYLVLKYARKDIRTASGLSRKEIKMLGKHVTGRKEGIKEILSGLSTEEKKRKRKEIEKFRKGKGFDREVVTPSTIANIHKVPGYTTRETRAIVRKYVLHMSGEEQEKALSRLGDKLRKLSQKRKAAAQQAEAYHRRIPKVKGKKTSEMSKEEIRKLKED